MSTNPLPPDYYEAPAPQPPPRRRNWKKIVAWVTAGMTVISAFVMIGLVALLHNANFRQYLLSVVYQRLHEATGLQLRMKDFSLHLSGISPAVDMYDVVVDGAAPYTSPPLLQAEHLSVSVQVVSMLKKTWYLKDIVIDHPVAHIIVDKNGENNLPKPRTADSTSQTTIFDLGIRHVMMGRGEVYYNDRQSIIDADLHEVQFQSAFDTAPKRYSGGLSYRNGQIHIQDLNTIVHNLDAEFDATSDSFTIRRGTLTSGSSQLSLTATLKDYAQPRVDATYQAVVNTGELRDIVKQPDLPEGTVALAGSVKLESDPKKPVLNTIALEGNATSGGLRIHTPTLNTQVQNLSATYILKQGDAEIRDLRANVLGGSLTATLKMRDISGAQEAKVQGTVKNIALHQLVALAPSSATSSFKLTGTANANVDATFRKTLDTLVARTEAVMKGTIAPAKPSPQPGSIPLEGEIHAQYAASRHEVTFATSDVRMPQTSLNLNGTVSTHSSLQVQFRSNDLQEVEAAAAVFGAVPEPIGLGGSAAFAGSVRGKTDAPQITGQLTAASLKVKGTEWRTVRTNLEASPSHLALRNGEVVPANDRGRITFSGDVGLNQWAFNETSPIQVNLDATQLNIADLKALAGFQAPVTGIVSANVSLRGTQLEPLGQATVNLTQLVVAEEPIQSASLNLQGTGDEVQGKAAVRMAAGNIQASGTYFPKRKAYDAQIDAPAIKLDQFKTLRARNLQLDGTLTLSAKGAGTVDDPAVQLTARIPQLQLQNQTISGLALQAKVADKVATFNLDSQAMNTYIRGNGKVNLTGAYDSDVTIDTSPISLQPILAAYMPAQSADLRGQTEIHGTLKGPLNDQTRLTAHITIPTLSLAYKQNVEFSAAQPIQVDFTNGVVTLQRTTIRGTGTDLQLQGTFPVTSTAPVSLLALGTIDLRLAEMFAPDIASSGQIQFNINGYGRTDPNVQGQIKIVNANFAGDGAPLGLQNGNGALNLTNDRLEIQEFQGKVGSGTLTARGGLTYRPSLAFNVSLTADAIRLLYPQGVREGIDANFTLTGSMESALLRGQVRLNELSFSPSFDLNDIAAEASGTSTTPPQGFAQKLQLDITAQSTNDLNLASSKLSLQGAANLRVRGTAAEPVVLGRVNLSGGDLIFRGNRYLLQPSTIEFVNPYRIEPRLNLGVDTTVQQYNIHMLFRGTMDQLRTTYSSEPALPPSDIINLLVFGKTTEAAAANPTPGNLGAQSMIASSVSSQVTSKIEKIAGISQLSVDPVLGGGQQDPGARVTIQQRVSGNLFVTFATDATSTSRQVIKLEYQATPRVSLSGVRDQNGGMAVDVRIRKTW